MTTIRVHLPASPGPLGDADRPAAGRSYDIVVGRRILGDVGPAILRAGGVRTVVVADAAVRSTHAAAVANSLHQAGVCVEILEVASGETSKSVASAERLWNAFADLAVDRATHVVAVGGGVVGDLTGFVAATFVRGLPVWQVPTTVVAQVDSAIGGKTGINLAGGKNLVGAFWQPRGVFADVETLATLPDREFRSGFAEVVKYGMILDEGFFSWLEGHARGILARDPDALAHAVERSASLKAGVVEQDELEISGHRAILNYGHTFAHAIETAAGYGALLHGEAVAIGMARAARLAVLLGRIPESTVTRQDRLLEMLGLPLCLEFAGNPAADDLLAIMARDKKSVAGRLRFVLPDRVGHVELVDGIDPGAVRQALRAT